MPAEQHKLLERSKIKDILITGPHNTKRTCPYLQYYGWEITYNPRFGPDVTLGDFHLFGPLNKRVGCKKFATDADVKQAVTSCLWTQDTGLSE